MGILKRLDEWKNICMKNRDRKWKNKVFAKLKLISLLYDFSPQTNTLTHTFMSFLWMRTYYRIYQKWLLNIECHKNVKSSIIYEVALIAEQSAIIYP